ncbi:MAG: integrin alpha [Planctomycetes bacterium]|nr:integrin alpha [Planctomycetota bacterium]
MDRDRLSRAGLRLGAHRLLSLLALALLAGRGAAQGYVLHDFPGSAAGDEFGWSVAGAGDVNSDGFADVVVGAKFADPGGLSVAGEARVYSGATGGILHSFPGTAAGNLFGWSVAAAGDVDGDGASDVIVGAPSAVSGAGHARVFSGASGAILHTFSGSFSGPIGDALGYSVAGVGDVNGDGKSDLLVGAPQAAFPGLVGYAKVYSGASGATLYTFVGTTTNDFFGFSVAAARDVNADGVPDLLVGGPFADPPDPFFPGTLLNAGQAKVFSGATGGLLLTFDGSNADDKLGSRVAGAGDVNGDGFADVAVRTSVAGAGQVKVFAGPTGTPLLTFDGIASGEGFGTSLSGAGDLNGDGEADLLAGAPAASVGGFADAGAVRTFSGATGASLFTFGGTAASQGFGTSAAGAGDVNADGFPDLVAGANGASPGGLFLAGQAKVLSVVGVPAGSSAFGVGCAGTGGVVPRISTFGGPPSVGNPGFGLAVSKGRGGALAFLFVGTGTVPAGIPVLGCTAYLTGVVFPVGPPIALAGAAGAPGAGYGMLTLGVPAVPGLAGIVLPFQWLVLDGASGNGVFSLSNALSLALLP